MSWQAVAVDCMDCNTRQDVVTKALACARCGSQWLWVFLEKKDDESDRTV